jgi:hypothetical protein
VYASCSLLANLGTVAIIKLDLHSISHFNTWVLWVIFDYHVQITYHLYVGHCHTINEVSQYSLANSVLNVVTVWQCPSPAACWQICRNYEMYRNYLITDKFLCGEH